MQTKVKVIFPAKRPGVGGWPYINFDYEKKKKEIMGLLENKFKGIEFNADIFTKLEEAKNSLAKEKGKYDGYVVFVTTNWTRIPELVARDYHPAIIADVAFHGSGGYLRTNSMIESEKLPVITVSSTNIEDVLVQIKIFDVIKKLKESKVLIISNSDSWDASSDGVNTMSSNEKVNAISNLFGVQFERMSFKELKDYYESANDDEAKKWQKKWTKNAEGIVEPTNTEIFHAAKLYIALKNIYDERKLSAITVDCLALHKSAESLLTNISAYPCLSWFQMNNDGQIGVCEADVDSTTTQLIIKYLTGRAAFVSDPVIDTSNDRMIYAHCVAPTKVLGVNGRANPYYIRSHNEDRKGASIQSILPVGERVTTVKFSALKKAFAIHQGISVENVNLNVGCRTKLAVETNTANILRNYHFEFFEWHRVSFYGDFRDALINIAKLYGLDIYEEDK